MLSLVFDFVKGTLEFAKPINNCLLYVNIYTQYILTYVHMYIFFICNSLGGTSLT